MRLLYTCLAALVLTVAPAARSFAAPDRGSVKGRKSANSPSDVARSITEIARLVRAIDATPDPGSAILSLDVRPGLKLDRRAFDLGLIGARVAYEPRAYRGPEFFHIVTGPAWRRMFVFKLMTRHLNGVGFHRGRASAPPP
jgi:hypothetical protein